MLFVRTIRVSHKSYTRTQTYICTVLHCQRRRTAFGITVHSPQFWEQVVDRHHVLTLFDITLTAKPLHHCIAMSPHVIEIVVIYLSVVCSAMNVVVSGV